MSGRRFHPVALLIAVSAHLALVFAAGPGSGGIGGAAASGAAASASVVHAILKVPASPAGQVADAAGLIVAPAPSSDAPANEPQAAPVLPPPLPLQADAPMLQDPLQTAKPETGDNAVLPLLAGPRYYLPGELTRKPTVLQDIPSDKVAVLADAPDTPVVARLLINEQGEIDQVVIDDAQLPEAVRRFVIESFANVRFEPGRLGDMAVKSELPIEITLGSAVPVTVTTVR